MALQLTRGFAWNSRSCLPLSSLRTSNIQLLQPVHLILYQSICGIFSKPVTWDGSGDRQGKEVFHATESDLRRKFKVLEKSRKVEDIENPFSITLSMETLLKLECKLDIRVEAMLQGSKVEIENHELFLTYKV
jgi:hypothetical protein